MTIRIEISGKRGDGKSTIALVILSALRNLGLERGVNLSGDDSHPERDPITQRMCLDSLRQKDRDRLLQIEIVTKDLADEVRPGYLPVEHRIADDKLVRAINAATTKAD